MPTMPSHMYYMPGRRKVSWVLAFMDDGDDGIAHSACTCQKAPFTVCHLHTTRSAASLQPSGQAWNLPCASRPRRHQRKRQAALFPPWHHLSIRPCLQLSSRVSWPASLDLMLSCCHVHQTILHHWHLLPLPFFCPRLVRAFLSSPAPCFRPPKIARPPIGRERLTLDSGDTAMPADALLYA
jgi:hypothetical protein